MAIQMRRGNSVDFNPAKMVPGEWAISQDNQKVYMCFAPGLVVEIGSASVILPYVYEAEAWAKGTKNGEDVEVTDPTYHNNSKYYAEQADDSADNASASETNAATSEAAAKDYEEDSEAWAVGTKDGTPVSSSEPQYENNAKYWAEAAAAIVGIGPATPTTLGIVKPDGTTTTVDPNGTGVISAEPQVTISGKKVIVV